jgi:hypothetical protein
MEKINNDAQKLHLDKVTLVAVSSIKINKTLCALKKSMRGIDFREVILISHKKPFFLGKDIEFKKCEPIKSINAYSKFMLYELGKYIDTEFALIVQYDSGVIRPRKWNNKFLEYDYIGAPWPENIHFTKDKTNVRVGNGGFSLRSRKLMNIFNDQKLSFTDDDTGYFNEDGVICVYHRKRLEDNGIRFAPVEIAAMFSHETDCDESNPEPFGFHKNKI